MLQLKTYHAAQYSDLIERIWTMENTGDSKEVVIPPSQYINIVFPIDQSHYSLNGQVIRDSIVTGLTLRPTVLQYPKGTRLAGIRCYPHGLYPFFNMDGKVLVNNHKAFLSSPLVQQVDLPDTGGQMSFVSNIYDLLSSLYDEKKYRKSQVVRDYYQYFRNGHTVIPIETYCKISGTNYTSLNRLFTKVIGLTPKQFGRLIKFRKSLCEIMDSPESLTDIGLNAGYFDQAHFIREFKTFLDCTPSMYKSILKAADQQSQLINYNFRII